MSILIIILGQDCDSNDDAVADIYYDHQRFPQLDIFNFMVSKKTINYLEFYILQPVIQSKMKYFEM